MNKDLALLQPYPFEKLAKLLGDLNPPQDKKHISLGIGEPKHPSPSCVTEVLNAHVNLVANYPTTKGSQALRETIREWCERRFSLKAGSLSAEDNILPVNGTREAIFAFTQIAVERGADALVLSPDPFYQIYEGAAYLAGASPYFMPTFAENDFIPDYDAIPEDIWRRCELLFVCSPNNPSGSVHSREQLTKLIQLSDKYDFILASDECYSEIYLDEERPPAGLLEICAEIGRNDFKNCVVFHSLSKRSNLPGLRSGFIAGDAALIKPFLLYRTYHGCAMPMQVQQGSIAAWSDEQHVAENREQYRQKFAAVIEILSPVMALKMPEASFYLWAPTPIPDDQFTAGLYQQQNLTVLPGRYLSRETKDGIYPGSGYVRMALVATVEECVEAAWRIRRYIESL